MMSASPVLPLSSTSPRLLETMVYLQDQSSDIARKSIQLLAMLTNPEKNLAGIEQMTTIQQLVDEADMLYPSPFKPLLMTLAHYALTLEDIPELNLAMPDLTKLDGEDEAERKEVEKQLQDLGPFFHKCQNLFTMDFVEMEGKKTFLNVSRNEDIVKRTKIYHNILKFIREILTLQLYAKNLIQSIELVGEINILNNENLQVFNTINSLINGVSTNVDNIVKPMDVFIQHGYTNEYNSHLSLAAILLKSEEVMNKVILDITACNEINKEDKNRENNSITNIQKLGTKIAIAHKFKNMNAHEQKVKETPKKRLSTKLSDIKSDIKEAVSPSPRVPDAQEGASKSAPNSISSRKSLSRSNTVGHTSSSSAKKSEEAEKNNSMIRRLSTTFKKGKSEEEKDKNKHDKDKHKKDKHAKESIDDFHRLTSSTDTIQNRPLSTSTALLKQVLESTNSQEQKLITNNEPKADEPIEASISARHRIKISGSGTNLNIPSDKTMTQVSNSLTRLLPVHNQENGANHGDNADDSFLEKDNSADVSLLRKTESYFGILADIRLRLNSIQRVIHEQLEQEQLEESEITAYQKLYNAMNIEYEKLNSMVKEEDKSEKRHDATGNLLNLLLDITKVVNSYYKKTQDERRRDVDDLTKIFEGIANNANWIDQGNSQRWDSLSFLTSNGVIQSHTRKNFDNIALVCNEIMDLLKPVLVINSSMKK